MLVWPVLVPQAAWCMILVWFSFLSVLPAKMWRAWNHVAIFNWSFSPCEDPVCSMNWHHVSADSWYWYAIYQFYNQNDVNRSNNPVNLRGCYILWKSSTTLCKEHGSLVATIGYLSTEFLKDPFFGWRYCYSTTHLLLAARQCYTFLLLAAPQQWHFGFHWQ